MGEQIGAPETAVLIAATHRNDRRPTGRWGIALSTTVRVVEYMRHDGCGVGKHSLKMAVLDVSVVIPTFRRPALLREAIASVRAQSGVTGRVDRRRRQPRRFRSCDSRGVYEISALP